MRRNGWVVIVLLLAVAPSGCACWPLLQRETGSAEPGAKTSPGAHANRGEQPRTEVELPAGEAAEACLAVGREMEKKGQVAEAIAYYEKAREHNPRLTGLTKRLGVLYDRQGNAARALVEYAHALEASPRDPDLLNGIGYLHYSEGHLSEAEKQLRRALEIQPNHPRAWVNLGLVLGEQERYPESYQAFARVVKPAEARYNLGVILARHGQDAEAVTALREALDADPNLTKAQAMLRWVEQRSDTVQAAAKTGP